MGAPMEDKLELSEEKQKLADQIGNKLRPDIARRLLDASEKLKGVHLDADNYKFKANKEGRRMKVYIKMTQEETDQYAQFKSAAAPNLPDDQFSKMVFFMGVSAFQQQIIESISKMTEEEKKEALGEDYVEPNTSEI